VLKKIQQGIILHIELHSLDAKQIRLILDKTKMMLSLDKGKVFHR